MKVIDSIVTQAASMAVIRRDIHAHPELCFEEIRTADLVAEKLAEWGIPLQRGLGGTGVVGIVKNGSSARAIGLRADMDALPMQEFNTFEHASRNAGKMHACGHDGHTAMLLAAAQYLAKQRHFDGTVYLIFQPAEEGVRGARSIAESGFLDDVDNVIAGHIGIIPQGSGNFYCGVGSFLSTTKLDMHFTGKSAHAGANPELGRNAILAAASAARPKIGDYPFTTLTPNLGMVDLSPTERFVIADIPGLIEGAHEGAGIGTRFLGHVERSGCLIHLVDGTQEDVAQAWRIIRHELEAYGAGLAEKPEVLALNKIDALTPELREEKAAELEAVAGKRPYLVSGVSGEGVPELLRAAWTEVRRQRGEAAPVEGEEEVVETPGGWTP